MGIDAGLETEKAYFRGRPPQAMVGDERGLFAWGLRLCEKSSTVCLRLIDPYADTVFDQAQLPVLLAELQAAKATFTNHRLEIAKSKYLERAKTWGGITPVRPEVLAEVRADPDLLLLVDIQGQFDRIIDMVRAAIDRAPPVYVR